MTSFEIGFAGPTDDGPRRADVLLSPAEGVFALATAGGHLSSPRRAIALLRAELERTTRGDAARLCAAVENTNLAHFRREGIGAGERNAYGVSLAAVDGTVSDGVAIAHVGSVRVFVLHGEDASLVAEPHVLPERRRGAPILTRALGLSPSVEVGVAFIVPSRGDAVILAGDELATVVRRPRILERYRAGVPPWTLANDIVRVGQGAAREGTVVVLRVTS